MAPLPENNTNRVWFDYTTGGTFATEHTVQFRYNGADRTASAQQSAFLAFLNAIGANTMTNGFKVLRVRTSLAGEDFSLPQTVVSGLAAFTGANGTGRTRVTETNEMTWQAHSATSRRRCDISIFGMLPSLLADNGRWPVGGSGAPAFVAPSVAALVSAGTAFVAIDGSTLIWYPYVNTGRNSYWKRRLRIS